MALNTFGDVRKVLEEFPLRAVSTPYGFDLPCVIDRYENKTVRLERGSGIAGRGGHWRIVERDGTSTPSVTTRTALRRLLREWLAGPKPSNGRAWYAKLNHNRYGDSYIWVDKIGKPADQWVQDGKVW